MKKYIHYFMMFLLIGCSAKPSVPDPALAIGSPEAKKAVAIVQSLAVKSGYKLEKFDVIVRVDPELGNFLIYLFPKSAVGPNSDRRSSLFAIVNAKSGQVIHFDDPAHETDKFRVR